MEKERIYIAGHSGLVGRALVKRFKMDLKYEVIVATRGEVDLLNRDQTFKFLAENRPDAVVISAARVGGIAANIANPVRFLTENLDIQNNLMLGAVSSGVKTIVMLGSSCIYPRLASQPILESSFMTGLLEPTNESYAVAKIAGIRLAQSINQEHGIRVVLPMPCNVYGPGDHFDIKNSHVLSALVKRFTDASQESKESLELWGTGSARREFIYSDDLADACHYLLSNWHSNEIINVGSGIDFSIKELAEKIANLLNFRGRISWDATKPDGMPRKLLDTTRLSSIGWTPTTSLDDGLKVVINEYQQLQKTSKS
jgi:GDP-L-fucose synthase